MGLIMKKVEIELTGSTMKYYENLGYKIPKIKNKWGKFTTPKGTKIMVDIKDLSNGSDAFISVICDNPDCINPVERQMTYANYNRFKKSDKFYCNKCSHKLFAGDKERKTKLKKTISFEQWCIEHDRKDVLDRWDYEKNNCKPDEVCYSSHGFNEKGYWFKCPTSLHDSELKSIKAFVNGNEGSIECIVCHSFAVWGINNIGLDFLERYWDYDKNIGINPYKISYCINKKVWFKCQEKDYHDSYDMVCGSFVKGNRCSYCSSKKIHPLDSLGTLCPKSVKLWSDKNTKTPYEYTISSGQKVWWKCLDGKHEDYYRCICDSSGRRDFRCPECIQERDESLLQGKVRLYLEELGYEILHEQNCTILPQNPKYVGSQGHMPFDNEILVNNQPCVIEVNGEQHYKITGFARLHAKRHNTTPKYELCMQQVRDRYKRIYAKSMGYEHLEIPYTANNTEETYKQLIDNKILQINDNIILKEAI